MDTNTADPATFADDLVERWHTAPDASPAAYQSLSDYMRLSSGEYATWAESGELPEDFLLRHAG